MATIEIGENFGRRVDGIRHRKQMIFRPGGIPIGPVFVYETSILRNGNETRVTRVGEYRGDATQGEYTRRITSEIPLQHQDDVSAVLRKLGYAPDMHFLN